MFVIDEVVEQSYVHVCERLKLLEKKAVQRSSSSSKVQCCKRIPELKCLVLGADGDLQVYEEDEESASWLTMVAKVSRRDITLLLVCVCVYSVCVCMCVIKRAKVSVG